MYFICKPEFVEYTIGAMKSYNISADIIRIIAGFGVVLIHVTDPFLIYPTLVGTGGVSWWILNVINSAFRFSVPVFIMLSGYLLLNPEKKDSFMTFYQKRLFRVAAPFFFWIIIYFIWISWLGRPQNMYQIANKILTVNLDHLYFLFIIVELYFITPFLLIFLRGSSKTAQRVFMITTVAFTLLLALIGLFFPEAKIATNKNMLTIFIPFVSYYFLGYYLRHIRLTGVQSIWATNVYLNLVLYITLFSNGHIISFVRQYESVTLFFMSTVVFVVLLNEKLWQFFEKSKKAVTVIQHLSGTIFGIYLVHMLVISGLDAFYKWGPENISSPLWVWVVVKIVVVFAVSYVITAIGKKIVGIKFLFG